MLPFPQTTQGYSEGPTGLSVAQQAQGTLGTQICCTETGAATRGLGSSEAYYRLMENCD